MSWAGTGGGAPGGRLAPGRTAGGRACGCCSPRARTRSAAFVTDAHGRARGAGFPWLLACPTDPRGTRRVGYCVLHAPDADSVARAADPASSRCSRTPTAAVPAGRARRRPGRGSRQRDDLRRTPLPSHRAGTGLTERPPGPAGRDRRGVQLRTASTRRRRTGDGCAQPSIRQVGRGAQ